MKGFINSKDLHEKSKRVAILIDEGTDLLNRSSLTMALERFKEAEQISRTLKDPNMIQISLGKIAMVAVKQGDIMRSLELISEKELICRQNKYSDSLALALVNKAAALNSINKIKEALDCAEEAYQIAEEHGFGDLSLQILPILEKIKKRISTIAHCCKCDLPMPMVTGFVLTSSLIKTQGCFKCSSCGKITCYDCSDNRVPCQCGAKDWIEQTYYLQGN